MLEEVVPPEEVSPSRGIQVYVVPSRTGGRQDDGEIFCLGLWQHATDGPTVTRSHHASQCACHASHAKSLPGLLYNLVLALEDEVRGVNDYA